MEAGPGLGVLGAGGREVVALLPQVAIPADQ